mmetsp:Transcript_66752/g.215102  ORF Transcript_66752/g.215102 Transcript_66752/m.215102 type:complete len:222 (-) Transcript_66752:1012-1677(-)
MVLAVAGATACMTLRLLAGERSRGGTCGETAASPWIVSAPAARCTRLSIEPVRKLAERLRVSGEPIRTSRGGAIAGSEAEAASWSSAASRPGDRSLLGAHLGELVMQASVAVPSAGCRDAVARPVPSSRGELLRRLGASTRTLVPGPGRPRDQRRRSWPRGAVGPAGPRPAAALPMLPVLPPACPPKLSNGPLALPSCGAGVPAQPRRKRCVRSTTSRCAC